MRTIFFLTLTYINLLVVSCEYPLVDLVELKITHFEDKNLNISQLRLKDFNTAIENLPLNNVYTSLKKLAPSLSDNLHENVIRIINNSTEESLKSLILSNDYSLVSHDNFPKFLQAYNINLMEILIQIRFKKNLKDVLLNGQFHENNFQNASKFVLKNIKVQDINKKVLNNSNTFLEALTNHHGLESVENLVDNQQDKDQILLNWIDNLGISQKSLFKQSEDHIQTNCIGTFVSTSEIVSFDFLNELKHSYNNIQVSAFGCSGNLTTTNNDKLATNVLRFKTLKTQLSTSSLHLEYDLNKQGNHSCFYPRFNEKYSEFSWVPQHNIEVEDMRIKGPYFVGDDVVLCGAPLICDDVLVGVAGDESVERDDIVYFYPVVKVTKASAWSWWW